MSGENGVSSEEIDAVEEDVQVDYVASDGTIVVSSEAGGSRAGIRNATQAEGILQTAFAALRKEREITGAAAASFDEQRNKAVYILNNDIISRDLDEADLETIPWANVSGISAMDKINDLKEEVKSVVQFYLANSDKIEIPKITDEE